MPSRKSFQVLDELVAKKSEKLRSEEKLMIEDTDFGRFIYIPPSAYSKISHRNEYSELKYGLYVGMDKLFWTDVVRERCSHFLYLDNKEEDMFVCEDWVESKRIIQELDAKMLTPAEYFCTINFLNSEIENLEDNKDNLSDMIENMTIQENEWFDAKYEIMEKMDGTDDYDLFLSTHYKIDGQYLSGGVQNKIRQELVGKWIDLEDMDPELGVPTRHVLWDTDFYHYWTKTSERDYWDEGMYRSHIYQKSTKQYFPAIYDNLQSWRKPEGCCIRLAFRPDEHMMIGGEFE